MPDIHGQIIRLREGAETPYRILHQNTFPSVLKRIADSHLTNYSIFHYQQVLFAQFEYSGEDYQADMRAIAADRATQDWWELTAPLQEPFPERKEGEWWAEMQMIFHQNNDVHQTNHHASERKAFLIPRTGKPDQIPALIDEKSAWKEDLHKIEIFSGQGYWVLYLEFDKDKMDENKISVLLDSFQSDDEIHEMEPFFFTPGAGPDNKQKKAFVTGCFDMLHSGHIEFLREASAYGQLHVCIGSDANVEKLKGKAPVYTQDERKYMLDAIKYVHQCRVNKGWGIMDFLREIDEIKPDVFVVNEDGNTPDKRALCNDLGIEYLVLKRLPHQGLPVRSTTALRTECTIPFRIDIAGGWLDQPFVSRFCPGPVITVSIEPTVEFNDRSGMASSTRRKAVELWKTAIPQGNPEKLAHLLFSYDNPPGTKNISGSQDALGIVLPGLNKLHYNGEYWPEQISSVMDESILAWLEDHLFLVTLGPRHAAYEVVEQTCINEENARNLATAAENCWNAILERDLRSFGEAFRMAFEAQVAMFPNMRDESISRTIELYREQAYGWKLSGAGGGGYLILVADKPIPASIRIKIRRTENL
jgi:cytidyltransferase-like protein